MNFLAHLYLSGNDREILVGNLMGDFVKGRVEGRFPPGIGRGIELHRKIDSFANRSEAFRVSKRRIAPSFGHYRGVLVDLFYDHFLAALWDEYSDTPLLPYLAGAYQVIRDYEEVLPERLRRVLAAMFTDWLPSYSEIGGIETALRRMSGRVSRQNPLGMGGEELKDKYPLLREDFRVFFPELTDYVGTVCRES